MGPDECTIVQQGSWSDAVIKAASACTKMAVNNCGLCTVYCDKQVQYETVVEQYNMTNQLGNLFASLDSSTEVEAYRGHLFDEQSVVEQCNSRQEDD